MYSEPSNFLNKRFGIFSLVSLLLILLCYFFVDKDVVYFFYSCNLRRYYWIHVVQQLPELLLLLSPLLLITALTWKKRNIQVKLKLFFFSASLSVLIANAVKFPLKFIFGRYWPETFKNNNISLLHNGVYGFNPFHFGDNYSSFPSGHTATIFAFATIVWMMYPRMRWICTLMCISVFIALMVLYYHFVSDLLAGAYAGIMLSTFIYHILRKKIAGNFHISK